MVYVRSRCIRRITRGVPLNIIFHYIINVLLQSATDFILTNIRILTDDTLAEVGRKHSALGFLAGGDERGLHHCRHTSRGQVKK